MKIYVRWLLKTKLTFLVKLKLLNTNKYSAYIKISNRNICLWVIKDRIDDIEYKEVNSKILLKTNNQTALSLEYKYILHTIFKNFLQIG